MYKTLYTYIYIIVIAFIKQISMNLPMMYLFGKNRWTWTPDDVLAEQTACWRLGWARLPAILPLGLGTEIPQRSTDVN